MKNLVKWLVLGMVFAFVLAGCAKLPQQEINDAQLAVDNVVKAGADIYTPDEIKVIKDELAAAIDEANKKNGKLFQSMKDIKDKLAKVKTDAEALVPTVAAKKEEAKNNALTAQTDATTALTDAKALVEKAPKGKGSMADIEAFKADLATLDTTMAEVQQGIDSEDFLGATEKANAVKEKALAISEQINLAIEKVKGKRR